MRFEPDLVEKLTHAVNNRLVELLQKKRTQYSLSVMRLIRRGVSAGRGLSS